MPYPKPTRKGYSQRCVGHDIHNPFLPCFQFTEVQETQRTNFFDGSVPPKFKNYQYFYTWITEGAK